MIRERGSYVGIGTTATEELEMPFRMVVKKDGAMKNDANENLAHHP